MSGGRTPPRRWERVAAGVAVVFVIALTAPAPARAATSPSLQLSGVIHTSPFAGTSTRMQDGEGSAYVARDDSLWLLDDNGGEAFEVNRATGALKKVVSSSEFRAAPRFGGGGAAGSNRAGDLESMAYDPVRDLLYAFSGKCCTSSELPTAFRLTRGSDNKFHVESYQPLPSGSDFTAAALRASDGKLYVGVGSDLRQYTYTTNLVGSIFHVSGLSGILGMSFSDDSADLYVVTSSQKLYRVNWTTTTIVSGWVFDLTPFGVRDSRAVERVGNQFYVLDGYDKRSSTDPLRHAVFVLNIGGGGDTTPPDTVINSGPSGSVSSTSATFTFSATETGSTFQCRIDGAAFAACTSPKSYSGLTNASHTFEVRAIDAANNVDPSPAARTWTVAERPPVANAQSVTLNEGSTSTVTLTGSDPDNDPLRFKLTSLPASGKLYDGTGTGGHLIVAGDLPYSLTGAGNTVTYQPNANYFGPDAFQFKANDGQLDSTSAATVSITVNHVNRPPVANNDSATTTPNTPVTVNVLANDSDPDNDPLTVTGVATPAHGTAVVNPDNTITYTSATDYAGPDSFTYAITDGKGGTASATVSIAVSSATPNLIGNPGFESDTSGWEAGAAFNALSRVAGGHSGGWAAQLSNTSAGAQCTLDDKPSWVGVTQAGAYTLSIWARSDTPGLTFKLRIREYKSGAQQGSAATSATLTSAWQQVTVVYTPAAPGLSNLDFQAFTVNSPVGVCFQADDASITH